MHRSFCQSRVRFFKRLLLLLLARIDERYFYICLLETFMVRVVARGEKLYRGCASLRAADARSAGFPSV